MKNIVCWAVGITISLIVVVMTDNYFLLSLCAIVYVSPFFLIIETSYIVISIMQKRKIRLVLSWCDLPILCSSIAIWGYLVSLNLKCFPNKSLANLIEPGVLALYACVTYMIRCCYAFKGDSIRMERWRFISMTSIPLVAVLLALLFPCLPE